MPVEERQNINFDHPSAFDWDLLSKHVDMLRRGEAIEQPVYSYLTCTRQKETIHVEPRKVVIIEGILVIDWFVQSLYKDNPNCLLPNHS